MFAVASLIRAPFLTYFLPLVIVKTSSGPRWVVGCRTKIDKTKLKAGTRVTLDMTTLTIMRILPREVDPLVYNMAAEEPGAVSYAESFRCMKCVLVSYYS